MTFSRVSEGRERLNRIEVMASRSLPGLAGFVRFLQNLLGSWIEMRFGTQEEMASIRMSHVMFRFLGPFRLSSEIQDLSLKILRDGSDQSALLYGQVTVGATK